MPKIVESLRSVFIMNDRCLAYEKPEIREIIPDLASLFIKIDPPKADLNFRHFRHFAILGISASSFIFTLNNSSF